MFLELFESRNLQQGMLICLNENGDITENFVLIKKTARVYTGGYEAVYGLVEAN